MNKESIAFINNLSYDESNVELIEDLCDTITDDTELTMISKHVLVSQIRIWAYISKNYIPVRKLYMNIIQNKDKWSTYDSKTKYYIVKQAFIDDHTGVLKNWDGIANPESIISAMIAIP